MEHLAKIRPHAYKAILLGKLIQAFAELFDSCIPNQKSSIPKSGIITLFCALIL